MSVLSDFEDWRENPEFQETGPAFSDYTGFYVGISIVTILCLGIIVLNFVFCCCSPYKEYWRDPNTGNRILFPVWIQTPHNQTPLTLQPELSQITIVDATKVRTQGISSQHHHHKASMELREKSINIQLMKIE